MVQVAGRRRILCRRVVCERVRDVVEGRCAAKKRVCGHAARSRAGAGAVCGRAMNESPWARVCGSVRGCDGDAVGWWSIWQMGFNVLTMRPQVHCVVLESVQIVMWFL